MTRQARIERLLRQLDLAVKRGDRFSLLTIGSRLRRELIG